MGLAEAWEGLKERYSEFIASLEEKGVPSPGVLVPALTIIVLLGVALIVLPAVTVKTQTITLFVKDAAGNPLQGAAVSLFADGKPFKTLLTSPDGRAEFAGVPVGVSLKARAEADNYTAQEIDVTAAEAVVSLQPVAPPAPAVVKVSVRDSATNKDVSGVVVELVFDDGTSYSEISGADGLVEFVGLPEVPSHATLRIEDSQYEVVQKDVSQDQLKEVVVIQLVPRGQRKDPSKAEKGTLYVAVDYQGEPVEGAVVFLTDPVTDSGIRSAPTGGDGIASIEDLDFGTRFYLGVRDPSGKYLTYNSPDVEEFSLDSQTLYVTLKLKTIATAGEIALTITTEAGSPISGAEVNLFNRANGRFLEKGLTDDSGVFKVAVAKGLSLYVTAWKEGYLPGFLTGISAGASRTIVLDEAVPGNSAELSVFVSANDAPAAGASVSLYKADGTFLGIPVFFTESDGIGRTLVPKKIAKIFATASREGYEGRSDVAAVTDPMSMNITITPVKAILSVTVLDVSTNQPVKEATVAAMLGETEVSSCEAAEGSCTMTDVEADQDLVVKAVASGYEQYSSQTVRLAPAERREITVYLYPLALAGAVSARFIGLFNDQGVVKEVANGETYQARFLATMPKNIQAGGFYVRVGSKGTAEGDVAAIRDYDTGVSKTIYSGATYSPEENCAIDSPANGTLDAMKWVEFQFQKGFVGTKEIAVNVKVSPKAKAGEGVEINFRAYAISGNTPALSPTDEELMPSLLEKTTTGIPLTPTDFCQAKTFTERVPVTSDPLVCDEKLCFKAWLEDLEGVRGRSGAFEVEVGKEFIIRYEVLAEYAVDGVGIKTDYAEFLGPVASELSFASASLQEGEEQRIPVTISAGTKYAGGFRLKATATGTGAFATILVHSPEAETKQFRTNFAVAGKNAFSVSMAPQTILTGEKSPVKISVKDKLGLPVRTAAITLYDCDQAPLKGREYDVVGDGTKNLGEDGVYLAQLEPQAPGMIGVRVVKEGFKTYDKCELIVEGADFLEINPDILEPFTGVSSQSMEKKHLEVTNLLSTRARIATSVVCAGAPNTILSVTPKGFALKEKGTATVFVSLRQNVTADAVCMVHFAGKINNQIVSEIDVPIQVSVQGPQPPQPIPGVVPLPNPVWLLVDEMGFATATYSIAHLPGVTGATVRCAPPLGYAQRYGYQTGLYGLFSPGQYGVGFCEFVYSSIDFDKKTLTLSTSGVPPEAFAQSNRIFGTLILSTTAGGTLPAIPLIISKWGFLGVGAGLAECVLPGMGPPPECDTIYVPLAYDGYYLSGSVGPRTYIVCKGRQVPLTGRQVLWRPCGETVGFISFNLGVGGLLVKVQALAAEGRREALPRKATYLVYTPDGSVYGKIIVVASDVVPGKATQLLTVEPKEVEVGQKVPVKVQVTTEDGNRPVPDVPVALKTDNGEFVLGEEKKGKEVTVDTDAGGETPDNLFLVPDKPGTATITGTVDVAEPIGPIKLEPAKITVKGKGETPAGQLKMNPECGKTIGLDKDGSTTLYATVFDNEGKPVKDHEVTFSINKDDGTLAELTTTSPTGKTTMAAKTNDKGVAGVKMFPSDSLKNKMKEKGASFIVEIDAKFTKTSCSYALCKDCPKPPVAEPPVEKPPEKVETVETFRLDGTEVSPKQKISCKTEWAKNPLCGVFVHKPGIPPGDFNENAYRGPEVYENLQQMRVEFMLLKKQFQNEPSKANVSAYLVEATKVGKLVWKGTRTTIDVGTGLPQVPGNRIFLGEVKDVDLSGDAGGDIIPIWLDNQEEIVVGKNYVVYLEAKTDKRETYGRYWCTHWPQRAEDHCTEGAKLVSFKSNNANPYDQKGTTEGVYQFTPPQTSPLFEATIEGYEIIFSDLDSETGTIKLVVEKDGSVLKDFLLKAGERGVAADGNSLIIVAINQVAQDKVVFYFRKLELSKVILPEPKIPDFGTLTIKDMELTTTGLTADAECANIQAKLNDYLKKEQKPGQDEYAFAVPLFVATSQYNKCRLPGIIATYLICSLDYVDGLKLNVGGRAFSGGGTTEFDEIACWKSEFVSINSGRVRVLWADNTKSCYVLAFDKAEQKYIPDAHNHLVLNFRLSGPVEGYEKCLAKMQE